MTEAESNQSSNKESALPFFTSQNSDLVKLSLNNDDIMQTLQIALNCLEWDSESHMFVRKKESEQLISNDGLNHIMLMLSSLINRNTTLSNLEKDDVRKLAFEFESEINFQQCINHDKWKIKKGNISSINIIAGNMALMALNRAKDGVEMQTLGGNTKTLRQVQDIQSRQNIIEGKAGLFK